MPSQEEEEDDTGCLVEGVAETMRLGQSYKSIGFDRERAIVHRDLADRGEEGPANCDPSLNPIQSDARTSSMRGS